MYSGIMVDLACFADLGGLCGLSLKVACIQPYIVWASDHEVKLKCNNVTQQDNNPKRSHVDL